MDAFFSSLLPAISLGIFLFLFYPEGIMYKPAPGHGSLGSLGYRSYRSSFCCCARTHTHTHIHRHSFTLFLHHCFEFLIVCFHRFYLCLVCSLLFRFVCHRFHYFLLNNSSIELSTQCTCPLEHIFKLMETLQRSKTRHQKYKTFYRNISAVKSNAHNNNKTQVSVRAKEQKRKKVTQ